LWRYTVKDRLDEQIMTRIKDAQGHRLPDFSRSQPKVKVRVTTVSVNHLGAAES
jgi:hypothetical protein